MCLGGISGGGVSGFGGRVYGSSGVVFSRLRVRPVRVRGSAVTVSGRVSAFSMAGVCLDSLCAYSAAAATNAALATANSINCHTGLGNRGKFVATSRILPTLKLAIGMGSGTYKIIGKMAGKTRARTTFIVAAGGFAPVGAAG